MKTTINIVFAGANWIDLTNGKPIGDKKALVKYVNEKRLRVLNENVFLLKNEFWYNK